MSDVYTVVFFGHRHVEHALEVEETLFKLITELLRTHEYVEFLMGRDGEFDLLAASVVRKAKRDRAENSSLVWVLPYETAEFRKNTENYMNYYDEIEICEKSAVARSMSGACLNKL